MMRVLLLLFIMFEVGFSASYRDGHKALRAKNYAKAAADFWEVSKSQKDKKLRVKAEWGLAESLRGLELYQSASRYYTKHVRRGPQSPYFRRSLQRLGSIHADVGLGQSHIVRMFREKVNPSQIPGKARGFYFYFSGSEAFHRRQLEKARSLFTRVQRSSEYYLRARFYLGVISNLSGRSRKAIEIFDAVSREAPRTRNGNWLRQQSILNIARVYYELGQYRDAIRYYSRIHRDESVWLNALFESAWAFYLMEKPSNTLGNIHTIHSPYFSHRFFPETHILKAVTFLKGCHFQRVKKSIDDFHNNFKPVSKDLDRVLKRYRKKPRQFFELINKFKSGRLSQYKNAKQIFDALGRTDSWVQGEMTIRSVNDELRRLRSTPSRWRKTKLTLALKKFLVTKKSLSIKDSASRLYVNALSFRRYLAELSGQTRLIKAEMLLGKVDSLRAKVTGATVRSKVGYVGGLKEVTSGEKLEFWPFQGEYWEDELGWYVYNIKDKCR